MHETESQLVLNGSYNIGFTMDLACKDLGFAYGFGRELGVPLELAKYMMLGVHTTFGHRWGVEQTLLALYETGGDEGKMAESISLPFLAAGINRLIDASEIWLELIRSGRVTPSEPFRIWAETSKLGALKI